MRIVITNWACDYSREMLRRSTRALLDPVCKEMAVQQWTQVQNIDNVWWGSRGPQTRYLNVT